MQGFTPRKHPSRACSLDCIAKLRFAFQPAHAGKTVTPYISLQPATVFRPQPVNIFQAGFFTEHHTFRSPLPPARRQPANNLSPHIFSYQPSQPHASQQPSFRLDRPIHFRSHFFFFFFLFLRPSTPHKKKETGKADFHLFFLQSQI